MTQNESKKPKEDDPKVAAVQTQASTELIAQEATSRQIAERERAGGGEGEGAALGIGKDKQRLAADWGRQISAYFELHKRYPKVKKNKTATVKVSLVLNRLGNVVEVGVLGILRRPGFRRGRDRDDPPLRSGAAPAGRADAGHVQLQPECEFQRAEMAAPSCAVQGRA